MPIPLVWINFSLATLIRIAIIGVKISLEYIGKRIEIHTVYILTILASFSYSAHTLAFKYSLTYIVFIVDVSIIFFTLVIIVIIKCVT